MLVTFLLRRLSPRYVRCLRWFCSFLSRPRMKAEIKRWSLLKRPFCTFVSLSLSRLWSHQPASPRQAVCKGTSQLARPRLINDGRQAGFQAHKIHSVESRSAASPKPISWQKSACPVLAKFPGPAGSGGESILGLPGEAAFSEWQIVLCESQCGSVATGANLRDPPRPLSRGTQVDDTAQVQWEGGRGARV